MEQGKINPINSSNENKKKETAAQIFNRNYRDIYKPNESFYEMREKAIQLTKTEVSSEEIERLNIMWEELMDFQ